MSLTVKNIKKTCVKLLSGESIDYSLEELYEFFRKTYDNKKVNENIFGLSNWKDVTYNNIMTNHVYFIPYIEDQSETKYSNLNFYISMRKEFLYYFSNREYGSKYKPLLDNLDYGCVKKEDIKDPNPIIINVSPFQKEMFIAALNYVIINRINKPYIYIYDTNLNIYNYLKITLTDLKNIERLDNKTSDLTFFSEDHVYYHSIIVVYINTEESEEDESIKFSILVEEVFEDGTNKQVYNEDIKELKLVYNHIALSKLLIFYNKTKVLQNVVKHCVNNNLASLFNLITLKGHFYISECINHNSGIPKTSIERLYTTILKKNRGDKKTSKMMFEIYHAIPDCEEDSDEDYIEETCQDICKPKKVTFNNSAMEDFSNEKGNNNFSNEKGNNNFSNEKGNNNFSNEKGNKEIILSCSSLMNFAGVFRSKKDKEAYAEYVKSCVSGDSNSRKEYNKLKTKIKKFSNQTVNKEVVDIITKSNIFTKDGSEEYRRAVLNRSKDRGVINIKYCPRLALAYSNGDASIFVPRDEVDELLEMLTALDVREEAPEENILAVFSETELDQDSHLNNIMDQDSHLNTNMNLVTKLAIDKVMEEKYLGEYLQPKLPLGHYFRTQKGFKEHVLNGLEFPLRLRYELDGYIENENGNIIGFVEHKNRTRKSTEVKDKERLVNGDHYDFYQISAYYSILKDKGYNIEYMLFTQNVEGLYTSILHFTSAELESMRSLFLSKIEESINEYIDL